MVRNVDPPDGTMQALRNAWATVPVLPVLRTANAAGSIDAAERLAGLGVRVIELTATTPDWPEAARTLRTLEGLVLGLGTVRSPEVARRAADEGLDFLVSPHLVPEVRDATPLPLIEGAWSPTELASAADHGVAKLFPAHVGGPAYLRSVRSVLPAAEIVPTGGIEPDDVIDWVRAGAVAVGLGSSLVAMLSDEPTRADEWIASLTEERSA